MITHDAFATSCNDYATRRQDARDHGQKLAFHELPELPVANAIELPAVASWIALSSTELVVAVAWADTVGLYHVADMMEAVRTDNQMDGQMDCPPTVFAGVLIGLSWVVLVVWCGLQVHPAPFYTFAKLPALEIAWCTDADSGQFAVLTLEQTVVVCTLDGTSHVMDSPTHVSSSTCVKFIVGVRRC